MTSATLTLPKAATVADGFLRSSLYIPELRVKRKSAVLEELAQTLWGKLMRELQRR